ncbi:Hydrocephalus-inducing protein [Phytophthora rubi]|uniref:Hydrocephalus-inducing protein n=1 Tax=Phytophthora rubi TaxID=129364 RepID=A0A6A4FUK9_9STRA|nr:Hydrocephalus-inducing protein [Phytophthora rubi]
MSKKAQRLKPSEILTAFSVAKAHAAKHATSRIVELVNAEDHTTRVSSSVPLHQPLFEPTPAEVWIDEYTPFQPLTIKLRFRNCDSVVRRLKIEPPRSPVFRVRPWDAGNRERAGRPERVDGKVAAGMEVAFALDFLPQEVTEYAIDLVCCTERERFLLPVRVRGRFAALDLPDELEFGVCPVKMPTNRVLTVRNVGTRGSSFAFQTSEHFRVTPPSATLAQGAAVQIELVLVPPDLESGQGELEVKDDSGQTAVVQLAGRVVNVDVFLSQPLVEPNATYLSLSSRKTVKICNESEFTLDFAWKSFADRAHEELERTQLLEELSRMEAAEREQLQLQLQEVEADDAGFTQSPFDVRKTLDTKYRHLRKATLDDSMQFVDSCFSITPLSGRVWAHSEVDVVVCFTPEVAHLYSCYAFLEIAGQAARLPLQVRGQGIGPKAKVVYNELLDFGDVFINDERTRDFTIQNKGEIPAEFELIPLSMPSGTTLSVYPSRGTLAVNAMLKIEVTFFSQELGEAFHHIRFSMQGSDEQLTVRFKANVIPPVFHFDADQVDFGAVSYSFPQTRTVKLINASKIAIRYSLRIPEEASYKHKEFELVPSDGKLNAYGEQQITVRFTSHNVKTYQYQLVVGVTGVGADLLSIPVRAQCFVPELIILRQELDFGRCFLRYPHKQMLELENKSTHLYGRFEIGEQDDHSRAIATYSASEFSGSVGPGERSTDLPLSVTLSATGSGPKVELDQPEINWGNCTCLVDHERLLRMTNVSLIPASYKTFIRNARSKFQIDRKEGVLMAGESQEFVLVANLDDTVVFKDQLHILITEGDNLVVPLSIKGTGTTMWSPSELRVIDFSHQMTSKECEWSCTLENKGKRVQVLTWVNKTVVNANSKISSADQGSLSKKGSKVGVESRSTAKTNKSGNNRSGSGAAGDGRDKVIPVFSVFPGTIELKPRTACIFVFKGLSSTAGLIQEELVCETRVGKEKANKVAFVTAVCANFVDPKLTPSSSLLSFEYIHHPGNQIATQSQPLSLTNACELPLSFTLRTQTPFALDCWEAVLQPGEKVDLNVEFYPGFKDDYTCRVINGKVLVSYTGHPQKDSVELLGDISFPNLSFETTKIDFGCTLNDTQKSISLNVTNVSKVDTSFRWVFIEDEKEALPTATAKKPYIPINQVFDILPIRGLLKPNESEKIEFVYYGHANRKFKSTVACEVEGGPEYELTLSGEASSLVYKLDKQSLDFGQVLYNKTEDRDFSILNVGKVPFSFNIIVDNIACGRTLEISPTSGKIAPNEKQRILVRLRPGIPEYFEETVVLEIAHFQPIQFKLVGSGTFAAVSLNLPRENHPASVIRGEAPKWKELKKRAKQNIELGTLNAAAMEAKNNQVASSNATLTSSESKSTLSTTFRGNEKNNSVALPASPHAKAVGQRLGAPGSPVRGAAALAVAAIDELDIEIEACRLFFADYLLVQEQKRADARALKSADPSNEEPAEPTETIKVTPKPSRPPSSTSEPRSQKKRGPEVFPFILSQFVLDFGNVVVGAHKIKRFSVTNIGHGPASFQLDKNLASSRGFQIEPERVVRLPEKQSVEFTVTFHARKNIEMGLHMAQLPIVTKNGPPCIAMVRALVTVPDISISTESLDFGKIAVSTCHTMFTQLQNVSAVPAEWAFKKPMGSTKDVGNFRFTPQSGLLTPGAKVNIQIEFVPDDGRQFMLKLPIKTNSNPKTRSIVCRGEGSDLRISFYPPLVELGPVLPCALPEEQLVEIRNDSDYAVEIFSLDFDSSYEQDEALLRSLSAFTSGDTIQLPIRVPGQPITEYLADNGLLPVNTSDVTESMVDTDHPVDPRAVDDPSVQTPEGESFEDSTSQTPIAAFNSAPRKGIDYVVVGPPRCGKSTQARLLAEKECLSVWTIDGAVKDVCAAKGPLATAVRKALGIDIGDDEAVPSSEGEEGVPADNPQETPESEDARDDTPVGNGEPESVSDKLARILDQVCLWRLAQPDLKSGSILDGFSNSFLSFEQTLKCCSKVFVTARIILLGFDEDCYESISVLLTRPENKPGTIVSVTPSPSRDRLTPSNSGNIGSTNVGENNQESAEHTDNGGGAQRSPSRASSHEGEKQSLSGSPSRQTLSQSSLDETSSENLLAGDESNNLPEGDSIVQDKVLELARSLSASVLSPATFAEYTQALEAMKHQLALFMLRDEVEPTSMFQPPLTSPNVPSRENDADAVWAQVKDRNSPDNFLLEIPIMEVGPPLLVHSVIFSTIEKFVRELESSHLPIPTAAKFQLVRRPPERFTRKRIARFSLRSPSVLSSSPSEASSETSLHTSGSRSQVPSKHSSRPATAGKDPDHHQATDPDAGDGDDSQMTSEGSRPQSSKSRDSSSPACRWVIAPHSRVNMLVQFASADVGNFDCSMGFEIVGIRREFALFGRGICGVPMINSDPRNVFMHRVKSRPEGGFVQKKFVMSRNQFEFGPLIIATQAVKPPDTDREFIEWQKSSPNNVEVFRMSNSSKFPIYLEFGMEKEDDNIFAVFPPTLEIKEGDTKEVKVWANPSENGLHENALICCIGDNPEPVEFRISCYGCIPELKLRGPWEQPAAASTSEREASEVDEAGANNAPGSSRSSVAGSAPVSSRSNAPPVEQPPTPSHSPQQPLLDFEQLLLKRQDEKTFYIENMSPVPVSWRLLCEDLPADFRIFPVEGTIKPLQKAPVMVVFSATTEAVHQLPLRIEFSDAESALQVSDRNRLLELTLCGEAYKIDVSSFDSEAGEVPSQAAAGAALSTGARPVGGDGSLDFGLVRVGEKHSRSFNIRNRGKYSVKYIIAIRSAVTREYFTIDPSEMVLEPGHSSSVNVTFTSKSEVSLRDCKDIKCTIIEMLSGEACREFYVYTSARSVFSKFRLQPNRGINFGPHKFSDPAQSKRIEIRNDGEFPFKFRVQASRPVSASGKKETLMIETPISPSTLNLGQFAITPDCGTVDPGVTMGLDVVFQPKECAVYSETLSIEISGRNTDDAAETGMLLYELVGESCYPGINTTDYDNIFEEQTVVRSLGVESAMPSSTLRNGAFPGSIQAVTFAEKEKIFSFGPLITAANWKGTVERFKICNPVKVSCTVQFSIVTSPSSSGASGEDESEEGSQAFTVQPAVWEIPPLEHRFVSVYFRPTTIALFHAIFRAKVDDSPPQSNLAERLLEFEMRGEGTMPCVTVTEPTGRDSTGALVMDFGRVRTSKAKDMRLALRNDGILPATVLFSIQTNPNFLFALGNGSVVVTPKATETLTVQFRPQKVHEEPTTSQLKITVQNNPFEETTFKLFGTGYREDLVFEDLPRGHDDELYFDDIRLPDPSSTDDTKDESAPPNDSALVIKDTKVFSLCNQSSDIVRFEWPKADPFHFSPGIGHLRPKAHKLIRATFEPGLDGEKAIIFQAHRIGLQAQRISYKGSSASQSDESGWDESIQTISFDGQAGTGSVSKQAIAEPEYEAIGSPATIALSCFAAADVLSFDCDTSSIAFRKTFMLHVCTHKITVHNKSKIKLAYSWRWEQGHPGQSDAVGYPQIYAGVDENCPFEVAPESGAIGGEETQVFTIKFAPMEVDEYFYWLCFDVPDAMGEKAAVLKLDVRGGSLRPACHFDVERSDYAQWRAPNLVGPHGELGPLDPSVKVIEMESLGVRVRNTRRFYVVNPTNVSYEFSWTPQGEINPCFRCATPKGLMLAGKRCEMIFEFTPQQLELQEMFWYFKIPHFQVNQLFLFVGTTTEPRVALDRGSVNFNTLLIGTKTSQSIALVNQEHIPFNFVFDKTSLDFAGEVPALIVHPLSGVIPPNSRTSIEIEFIPTEEKSYSFNLNCIIKRKPTRLSLNVKGEGYSIHDALTLASDDHNESRSLFPGPGNVLDFGAVRVNEEAQRSVVIHNSGKFNFDFNWSVAKQPAAFTIEPMQGTIKKNDKTTCRLIFAPTKQSSLDGTQATCTVAGSRNYVLALQGNAVPPMLQFSFTSHDFGPCFIAENDSAPMAETTALTVFNMDPESGIDLDCLFEKKPYLRVDCPPTVLGPRETINIPIVFTARQEVAYLEMVPFTINGSSTVNVSIRGEGVFPKVELVNSSMQMVVLGNLQIGQQTSRTAKIANRSKRKTIVECVDSPQPGVPSLEALGISIFPQHEISLRAKESADIEFRFAPTQRIPSFQKDVFIRVGGSTKKLLTLSGCCQGIEVGLETDTLSYGAVCLGSQLVRKVRLQNRGDVATKFQWSVREFAPDFLVSPAEGVVAPNQHKTIEVTFKPAAVNPDIRYDRVTCMIDGTAPATLTLVGSCVPQATSSIQDVNFDSPVRQETHKAIAIENATAFPWNLFPVVQGDHWSCPENVLVPAHGKANLDVLYLPLTMTKQNSQEEIDSQRPTVHKGSIFLAIPDGSALLYNVLGKASAPLPAPVLSLSTAAKKTLSISIPIKNWLKTPQTFAVDVQKPPGLESVVVQGPSSILLHAGVTRNYNMKFFCYTEGTVDLCVRFVNQESGEYLAHDVRVAVSKAVDVDTLYFDASVRQSVKKTISIENPFERHRQINFVDKVHWWKCSSPSIRVRQISEISGRSEGSYEIEYRPTLHSETPIEDRLTISFVELGEYTYNLVLSTQSVGPERILYFKAPLGGSQTQTFTFTSYAETPTELSCSVQDPTSFSVPTSCKVEGSPAWEGNQESILIKFEPEAIGDFRDTLTLSSDAVGEYKCTLQGLSVPPLPQGPYVFSTSKDIEFKNVFSTPQDFDVMVDNPRFVVSTTSLSIPAKSTRAITVKIDRPPSSARGEKLMQGGASETGKLFVSCPQLKELPPWVYYLEATAT